MTYRMITPPAGLAVAMADAKLALRIAEDDTTLDASIERWIRGITLQVEHEIGRALITQSWRVTLDGFPDAVRLERPPTASVESVKYYDESNQLQTLDPADYYPDLVTEPGYVVPGAGKAWPSTYPRPNAMWIDFTVGYGAAAADVPDNIRMYILARLEEQFDAATKELRETARSAYTERLLDASRVYG